MKKSFLLVLVALLLVAFTAKAQDAAKTEGSEKKEEVSGLEVHGGVDAYFGYNFNEEAMKTSFTGVHNSFELGMANVILSQKMDKVSFVADLAWGPRADAANGSAGSSTDAIKQLFMTYAATDDLTITAGNFSTFVGYEVIDATGNFNYSTSYMFSNGPFYHTGVKADYAVNDQFGFMVGLFNDTDSKTDANGINHYGCQLSYAPSEELSAYFNVLHGREAIDQKGTQFDLTGTYQASKDLMVGLNATYKMISIDTDGADDQSWMGAALYLNYMVNDGLGLGFRGEYFDDPDGVNLGVASGSNVIDLTFSANMKSGPLTFIPEFRIDMASEDIFVDTDGKPTSTSPTLLFAVVYGF
ncbi:conserved hypothetical protein [Chloroherpeton thalassium ATCC 35110]|uniref:Porin n=1 Tax=Chloroherpeton thalassium (strain ATCC 35110 / GB-78) TaxID=517418 RepID=B3QUH3_CHLT3|nr:porin [Chloroherpeton thalassium]ACF12879.1 conserved hypothetical protein [Chloroherpeton thalassium ATCC 35110]